ncbi:MAG: hypothetical protein J5563_04150 [Clostridia bacterium]|nr:hypothetical protein [Clostridia bacterium]
MKDKKGKDISIAVSAAIIALIVMMLSFAVKDKPIGSYRNESYELSGLKNPDGTVVHGINYTPLYNYGWFVGAMEESRYLPSVIREELAIVSQLGFNSVRLMSPFGTWNANPTAAEKILINYDDFFQACRENRLTVDVCLPRYPDEDYKAAGSFTRWLVTEMVSRFDKKYNDVIVMWEVGNEPDLNIFSYDIEWGKKQYLENAEWNNKIKPCLQFTRDLLIELGVKKPISVGAMTTSLFTPWDAQNFDVINLHPYISTVEGTDTGFTSAAAKMDMQTLGYVRPIVYTEIAWISGNHSRVSDITEYCHENGLAYYVWGFAANSYEQCMQGIMDVGRVLRTGTLPFYMLQNYSKWWPVAAMCYDDSPTGGGTNILATVRSAIEYKKIGDKNLPKYMATAAQAAHSQMGALSGYWTPDFRELFLISDGNTVAEKAETALRNSVLSILPYIRTYGTYENDNSLGGTLSANYFENMYKYNTSRGQTIWRARFTMEGGKNGSRGIFMEYCSNLVLRQPLDPGKSYSVSVDLNPSVNSYNGVAIACGDDDDNTYNAANPGVYFRISHKTTSDAAEKLNSFAQPANTIQIYTVDGRKSQQWRKAVKLDENLFDADGYINIRIVFSGNGTKDYPLNAEIFSGESRLGTFSLSTTSMSPGFANIALFGSENGFNRFDNLILSDGNGNVILSDGFENGKYDYEFLTYSFGGAKADWSNEVRTDGVTNPSYYEQMEGYVLRLLGKKISYKTPKNFAIYECDGLLACEWDYSGTGESGFEIQRKTENGEWQPYWRTMAGMRSAVIPLFESDNAEYYYRISPVTSGNETTNFTSPVQAKSGNGASEDYIASYTDKNGNVQTLEVVGNGVYRSSDVKEIPEENNGLWIDRYVKKAAGSSLIVNEKRSVPISGDETTDEPQPPEKKKTETAVLIAGGAAIAAAVTGIAVSTSKIIRKSGGNKKEKNS